MGRGVVAGLLALALTATACGGSGPREDAVAEVNGQPLTEAELRYGQAPVPDDAVTYQPDVVLLPDGADAVVSVTADGVTWTIDGDARAPTGWSPAPYCSPRHAASAASSTSSRPVTTSPSRWRRSS